MLAREGRMSSEPTLEGTGGHRRDAPGRTADVRQPRSARARTLRNAQLRTRDRDRGGVDRSRIDDGRGRRGRRTHRHGEPLPEHRRRGRTRARAERGDRGARRQPRHASGGRSRSRPSHRCRGSGVRHMCGSAQRSTSCAKRHGPFGQTLADRLKPRTESLRVGAGGHRGRHAHAWRGRSRCWTRSRNAPGGARLRPGLFGRARLPEVRAHPGHPGGACGSRPRAR